MAEITREAHNGKMQVKWKNSAVTLLKSLIKCTVAFVLSGYSVGGEIYPFGVAFVLNMNKTDLFATALASALGYWAFGENGIWLKYLACLTLGVVFKSFFFNENGINKKYVPILSAFSVAVPSACITFMKALDIYAIILMFTEFCLAFGASYFFSFAIEALEYKMDFSGQKHKIAMVFLICITVCAFENVGLLGINLAIVLSSFLVLCSAWVYGEAGGAIIGSALGACCVIMGANSSVLAVYYPFAGLFCGMFKKVGKFSVSLSYFLTAVLFIMSSAIINDKMFIFASAALGTLCFTLIPTSVIKSALPINIYKEKDSAKALCHVVKDKVKKLGDGLCEIKKTTDEVSAVTSCYKAHQNDIIYDYVTDKLCKYCPNNNDCWQENYSITYDIFNHAINKLKTVKELSANDFPDYFKEKCTSYSEIGEGIAQGYHNYIKELRNQRQVDRLRLVVTEQLEGVSQMLCNLSDNIDNIYSADTITEARIRSYFETKKSPPLDCLCYTDKYDRLTVEVTIPNIKLARMNNDETILDLSEICERNMDSPVITATDEHTILKYTEEANFKVNFGYVQKSADGGKICGDCCKQIAQKDSFAYMILSDGMGTGKNAAIESAMTADMLYDLITNGSDCESAVKIINSALICKASSECFATVDIVCVDLFSAATLVYKAAAAPTYVLKNGKAFVICSKSLPVGILKDVSPEKSIFNLDDGDIILNVSDGVTVSGERWILSELESLKDSAPQEIAEAIYKTAQDRKIGERDDDITISVMKITKA